MDPQKLSQLDPKLREAYQRVMGAPIPQPQAPPPQAQTPPPTGGPLSTQDPTTAPEPTPTPTQPQPPIQPPTPMNELQPVSEPKDAITPSEVSPSQNSPNFTAPAPQAQTVALKKKKNIMPILIGIAALFFVAVYTLFWTKIFNFKLPFLPF